MSSLLISGNEKKEKEHIFAWYLSEIDDNCMKMLRRQSLFYADLRGSQNDEFA